VKVIKQSVFGVPNVTEFKNVLTDLTKKSAQKLVMNGIYMFYRNLGLYLINVNLK
jgi:hypothetical protein